MVRMGQCVGAERGLSVRAMFARFQMGRWFAEERGRGPRVVALRRASQVFFLLLFLFLLLRTEFRGTVGAGGDVRLHWPVRLFFEIDPLAALSNALATHALYRGLLWSLIILLPVHVSGAVLLRMDLPDGNAPPLLRQSEVGEQTRQAGDRVQSLQAMAEDEVCDPDCRAGGGGVRHGVGGVVRPVQPAGAVDGAVGAARRELRGECGVERNGAQRRWDLCSWRAWGCTRRWRRRC